MAQRLQRCAERSSAAIPTFERCASRGCPALLPSLTSFPALPCPALPSPFMQVRRELQRDTNSSQWVLNGQQARMRDVEELVRDKLKIQLDNLCQVAGRRGSA